ncbi:MAG TPA: hypothetical protein VFW19_11945 [Allosphingosinicella sp.]|nr:hypothetical protein [Allosphingosinicella sp.]
MRRIEFIAAGLIWLAAAALMPMVALTPIQAAHAAPVAIPAAAIAGLR